MSTQVAMFILAAMITGLLNIRMWSKVVIGILVSIWFVLGVVT